MYLLIYSLSYQEYNYRTDDFDIVDLEYSKEFNSLKEMNDWISKMFAKFNSQGFKILKKYKIEKEI